VYPLLLERNSLAVPVAVIAPFLESEVSLQTSDV
jgi:hypothetical protein